ncbi:MAG: hypothetical protein DRP66_06220 [Planctomycetota bacterium]|nr:MAG: hypothetical protein DRP66_06220 [Planctomycetota bacterium]
MSNKKLTILAVVAAVMVVLAVVTSQLNTPGPAPSYRNVNLIQGFDTGRIATVILKSKDEETKITKDANGRFVVANKDNYPALVNEINGLVAEILDIKTVDLITDDPKNHTDLGVSEDNARYIVKFLDSEAKPIEGFGGIIISESDPEKQGVYVRLLGENKVYLIDGSPWPRMSGLDYIDKRLTSVEADRIKSVKVTYPGGGYTLAKKDDSEDILLEGGVGEGKKFKGGDYKQVFKALTDMQFTDVQKASKAEDLNFDSTYTCTLADSTVYTLRIAVKDDKTFIKADAEFTGDKGVTVKRDGSESDEELKEKEAKLLAIEAAQKFRNRHTGWVYEIASWKANNLKKKLDDLLEDIPEEEKTSDAKTPTTTAPVITGPPADPNQPHTP